MLRFTPSAEEFASERRGSLERADDRLRPLVVAALESGDWVPVTDEVMAIFHDTAVAEEPDFPPLNPSESEPHPLAMRLLQQLQTSLAETGQTEPGPERDEQVERITKWLSTASINAGTEAAATLGPRDGVGVEWVTMNDEAVRSLHRDVEGQVRPVGETFDVGGFDLHYPGEPVGPPDVWIQCRCVLRPTYLNENAQGSRIVAAAASEEERTTAVIVALPAADSPAHDLGPEETHTTLVFMGEQEGLDLDAIRAEVAGYAPSVSANLVVQPTGRDTLGDDEADVVMLPEEPMTSLRNGLIEMPAIRAGLESTEQFPTYTPHMTLGYPTEDYEDPGERATEPIIYDRLALWVGDERYEFPLGGEGEMAEDTETEPVEATEDDEVENDFDPSDLEPLRIYGVLAPEGVWSGDGRQFAAGALEWRDLPLPLAWIPADWGRHDGAVNVGRIDEVWREDGLVKFNGTMNTTDAADQVIQLVAELMMRGISVDVDSALAAVDDEDENRVVFSSARVSSATMCRIPAFAEAFVALGTWDEAPDAQGVDTPVDEPVEMPEEVQARLLERYGSLAMFGHEYEDPETGEVWTLHKAAADSETFKRGPGWITNPKETSRLHRYWTKGPGAAKIRWGTPNDFYRCRTQLAKYLNPIYLNRTCAEWHHDALGIWPGQHAGGTTTMADDEAGPSVLVASAAMTTIPKAWFDAPDVDGPTPLTISDTGRIFGHIATWGTCHIGIGDACTEAPHSVTDYAYFRTGQIMTDAGPVAVGQISLGGGHADLKYGVRPAIAHYDSTSSAVADVAVGEDEHGIWFAGALRDDLTPAKVRELRAASLSGDWRGIRMPNGTWGQELVAALAVNVPGFPIPRAALSIDAGNQTSLVAAAIVPPREMPLDVEAFASAVVASLQRRERATKAMAALKGVTAEERSRRLVAAMSVIQGSESEG
jgi:2'-5' RNA ligase